MGFIKHSICFSFFVFLFCAIPSLAQSTEGPPNTAPDVDSMTLNRSVVYRSCSKSENAPAECGDAKAQYVEVTTKVSDKENDPLIITYYVTAGRIVGQGRKVYWHFAGAMPGVHTITAIADDGGGPKGRRMTKEVEVKECESCTGQ